MIYLFSRAIDSLLLIIIRYYIIVILLLSSSPLCHYGQLVVAHRFIRPTRGDRSAVDLFALPVRHSYCLRSDLVRLSVFFSGYKLNDRASFFSNPYPTRATLVRSYTYRRFNVSVRHRRFIDALRRNKEFLDGTIRNNLLPARRKTHSGFQIRIIRSCRLGKYYTNNIRTAYAI